MASFPLRDTFPSILRLSIQLCILAPLTPLVTESADTWVLKKDREHLPSLGEAPSRRTHWDLAL